MLLALGLLGGGCRVDKLLGPPIAGVLVPAVTSLADSAPLASLTSRIRKVALNTSRPGRLAWRVERLHGSSWLVLLGTTGNAPDTLVVHFSPTGLDVGIHRDTLILSTNNSEAPPLRLPVALTVHPCLVTAVPLDTIVNAPLDAAECGSLRESGMFARLFEFSGVAGDSVTLELQATGFDARLVLDTAAVPNGVPPLHQASACRGAMGDPCITYFQLPWTRRYFVEVTGATTVTAGTFSLHVAPPSAPAAPSTVRQLAADGVTPIGVGAVVSNATVTLSATLNDADAVDTLQLEAEVRPVGSAFTGTPTHTSALVENGADATVVVDLADDVGYHWQARGVDQTGRRGAWVSFGGNPETAADVSTAIPEPPAIPTALTQLRVDGAPIPVGGTNTSRSTVFRATLTDPDPGEQLRLEVELRTIGTPFSGSASGTSTPVGSGSTAVVTIAGLSDNTSFHWRARTVDQSGAASAWESFGGNADGVRDFLVAAPAASLVFSVQPSNTTAGAAIAPAVQVLALDVDGNVATSFTGMITVTIGANPGSATLSGTTAVAAAAGVATFSNLRLNRPGAGYTLVATSGTLTATSATFAITPAPAVQLVFTTQPSTETAGIAITPAVVVTARDSLGNTATGFTGNVSVAIGANPGGGVLSGTATVAAAAGVAAFANLRINRTGTGYTLTATSGTLNATSAAFNITAAPAVQLAFTGHPTTTTAGVAISPAVVVTARDSLGNTATGFTGNVAITIAVNPSGGVLSGTSTVAAVGGVATLANLRINRSGANYTLNATSGTFVATSAAFSITAAPPQRLAFTVQPNGATAGEPVSPPVQVTAQDSLGNTTTVFAANVTVAIGTNPGGGVLSGTLQVLAVGGLATFANLRINAAGVGYTLTAAATGLTPATSAAFTVSPGNGTSLAFTGQPSATTAGVAISPPVAVTLRDAQGNTATAFNGPITVALGSNPGGGTLTGTLTVNAVAGVATFTNLRINRSGTGYTLTASATGASGATSGAFNIAAAPAILLAVTTQPGNTTAGIAITPSVVVTARDSLGNTATAFAGDVTMAIAANPGGGTLTGAPSVTAAAGAATFSNLRINRTGTGYTLTATSGAMNVTTAPFNITPAPPQRLVFTTQPTTATAGALIAPPVQAAARDSLGNPTPAFTGQVTVAIGTNPAGGTLSGTTQATAAAGVATFGNLSINTAGTGYTLTASATGLTAGTSSAFNIVVGTVSASQSTVTATPGTIAASAGGITSTITVTARDATGNPVAGVSVALAATGSGNLVVQPAGPTNASGVTTGTLSSTAAGAKTVSAQIAGVAINQTTTVTVTAAAVAAAQSSVGAAPGSITASMGTMTSTVTVTARDQFNNPVSGATVVIAATGTGNTVTQPAGPTNPSGVATGSLGSTVAQVKTVSATINAVAVTQTASVTVVAAAAAAIAADAGNGQSATAGTAVTTPPSVIVRDQFNNPVGAVNVTFTVTGGGGSIVPASPASVATNLQGVAAVTSWTLGPTAGANTLSAASGTLSGSPVAFTATATVGAPATMIKFSGDNLTGQVGAALATPHDVLIRDAQGNAVPGVSVTWAAASGGGSVNPPSSLTDANGHAQATRTLGTAPGTQTTSATATLAGGPAVVTFNVTAQVGGATQMTINGGNLQTDTVGQALPTPVSVRVADQFNNPVQGVLVSWTILDGGGSRNPATSTTNASGIASTTWTLGTQMTPTDSAQILQATAVGSPVTFTAFSVPGPVSASQTLHTVAPATITASTGGTVSTITVTARDQFNNVIRGKSVTLAATGTGNTLTQPAALTNVNGVATGTLSSTVIGQKTVSVTVTGVAITQTRIVTVNPAAANRLAFVIQPTSATAGVAIAPAIQVEIRDQFENRTTSTAGVTLAIGTNPGGGTLTGGGPLNAVAGRATFPAASINRSGTGYTLTATSGSLTAATSTAFSITAAGVSASQSTVVAAPGSITASSGITTSTITVTARDQFGNPISGATVVLAASGSGNTLTQPVGTTSAGGVATGTLSSTVAQAKTVSATINTVAITQTAAVTVTPAAVSAAQSTVGAAPGSIVASSGGTTSTITVTARDLFNNPISGATVALAATGTGNALVQPGSTNASGVATGTISSTVAETKAVSATVNGLAVTQTASVTVTAAAVSAALSTVSAAPGSIVASSGGTTSTITVTARDQFSNPISGATVALAATGTGNGLVQPAGSTSASGVTTGTLSATVAQAKTVSATINSVAITQTASVTVTAAAVSAAQSTVSAAPGSIVASSGGATSTITVTARDQFSNPVGGATVALAASGSGNNLVQPVGTTSASGVATGTLSSTAAQAKTVSATINAVAITQTATVTVTAAAAAAIAVSAGNGQSAPVNTAVAVDPAVIVRDGFNNPVSGVTVTFTLTGGGGTIVPASPAAIQTDAAGIAALTTWTLGAASGVNTLSAASGSLSGSPVVFTATATSGPVSAALSSVGAAPGSIAASSGATTSTVTVTARDQSGNPIAGATVVVAATGSGNTVTQPGVTNASGVATGALSSTAAETKTVSATINGVAVTQTAAVIVTPAAVSAGQSLVSAAPASIVASGGGATSTITVTARDQFTNPVNGATVVLSATGTGNTLAQPAGTNASGVATGTLSSTVAQTKTVAATINGVPVTQTATVTVTAAAAAAIAVSAGNGQTATVNTAVATAPAVVVHDAFGNPVGGVEVAFTVTAGGGSILPAAPSIATNASGVATLNRWTLGTTAGANTLQAAASGLAGSPVVFTATATPAAATQIAVHAGDAQVATVNTAVLTDPAVIARDQFGNPVPGVSVTFTVTGGGGAIAPVSPATVITDINGVAALSSWTLGTGAGANTLSAASGGLAGSPVAFTATGTAGAVSAAQSTVAAAPGSIVASSGGATSAITATARDQFGNPITGATVALTATGTGNTVTQPAGPTGPGGVASGAVSSTFAQAKTVSATINGVPVTQTATVTVTAAAASSIALQAGSGQSATVTTAVAVDPAVIVSDAFGNPVGGVNVTFTVTAGGGSIAPASPATIATGVDGIAALTSWTLGTSTAQANTLSAASGALAGSPVLFTATATPGAPSATQSSITTLPAVITASSGGSASTVTVTVRDQFNNPVSGVAVAIFTTGTDNAITQPAGPTSASGVTNGTLSSTRAENKTVSATINGVLITQTATLEVTPAAAAQLAFTQQPSNAAANTAISPPVVVTVRDSFGNTVTGFAGTVTMQIAQDASLLQNAQLGGLNPVSVVNGAATFANLAINELGVGYTLRAVAGALSVVSAAFSIIP